MPTHNALRRRPCAALMVCLTLAGCSSGPKAPYLPPDTPAGKLRSIAYLPYLGAGADIIQQQQRATEWASWWNDIYPGTRWVLSHESSQRILTANLSDKWLAAEKTFVQLGALPKDLLAALCDAQQTEGVLQMALAAVQAGGITSSWFQPWWVSSSGTPATARMSAALYSCATGETVWRHTSELTYKASYSQEQMVDYVQRTLAGFMPR